MTVEQAVAVGTALTALFALWLAERRSRFDARRAFVEFTLKQRTNAATELMAALMSHMQVIQDACFWHGQVTENRNVEVAARERNRLRDDLLPPSTKRVNDALAAAELAFSEGVINRANEAISWLNNLEGGDPTVVPVFDRPAALGLLGRVAVALRTEMLFPEVLRYQERLFERRWWERR